MKRHLQHTLKATQYSIAGFKRLIQETAAQGEFMLYGALLMIYFAVDATALDYALLTFFFLLILALEALNTAVEVLVDHLTVEIAEFARQAKDLGSFAVGCGLTMICLYSIYVVYKAIMI